MTTIRLFSTTYMAWRSELPDGKVTGPDNPEGQEVMQFTNGVALMENGDIPKDEFDRRVHELFPAEDGWTDHQVAFTEIDQGMQFGPYSVSWEARLHTLAEKDDGAH